MCNYFGNQIYNPASGTVKCELFASVSFWMFSCFGSRANSRKYSIPYDCIGKTEIRRIQNGANLFWNTRGRTFHEAKISPCTVFALYGSVNLGFIGFKNWKSREEQPRQQREKQGKVRESLTIGEMRCSGGANVYYFTCDTRHVVSSESESWRIVNVHDKLWMMWINHGGNKYAVPLNQISITTI